MGQHRIPRTLVVLSAAHILGSVLCWLVLELTDGTSAVVAGMALYTLNVPGLVILKLFHTGSDPEWLRRTLTVLMIVLSEISTWSVCLAMSRGLFRSQRA